jgi:hypothetical protein
LEKLPETAMPRIDASQQFALVKSKADRVVGLSRAGLEGRRLARHDPRQPVEIGDDFPVNRLVEGKQSRLVSQQLPNGDRLLAALGKLRPVGADAFLIIEPATGMRERKRHRREALGGGVHQDHRVLLPRLAG